MKNRPMTPEESRMRGVRSEVPLPVVVLPRSPMTTVDRLNINRQAAYLRLGRAIRSPE